MSSIIEEKTYNTMKNTNSEDVYNQLAEYTRIAKYAQFNKKEKRRETWSEQVDRVFNMHKVQLQKFLDDEKFMEYFNFSKKLMNEKKVLGSQRALQFGGPSVLNKNARIYNCCSSYVNRVEVFQQLMFVLLCGCGAGFSVQKHHIDLLPSILKPDENRKKEFIIPDTIEGWSDAIGVLVSSYFTDDVTFPDYKGYNVNFNYSLIRKKGSPISNVVGKAPGPDGLKSSIEHIRTLLNTCCETSFRLRPIDAYDIIMHVSNAVLSGGIRRCNPKGALVIVKNKTFKKIEDIEIGDYVSTNDGWKQVLNTFIQGIQQTIKITHSEGELICTPNHRVAILKDIHGGFEWKEAGNLQKDDRLLYVEPYKVYEKDIKNKLPNFKYVFPKNSTTCKNIIIPELDDKMAWLLGNIQGDGYVMLTSKSGQVNVAVEPDNPTQVEFVKEQLERFGINAFVMGPRINDKCSRVNVKSKQLATYFHSWLKQPNTTLHVPQCILEGTRSVKFSYIQGVMDADGCIKGHSFVLQSVYPEFVNEIQNLLYSLGIVSRNKPCSLIGRSENWKPLYKLSILLKTDRDKFNNGCSFGWKKFPKQYSSRTGNTIPGEFFKIQNKIKNTGFKTDTPIETRRHFENNNFVPIKVISIEPYKEVETYDIEVEGNHNFLCEGILVHNSACLTMFSPDDLEMTNAKTGNWFEKNPQRGRSNNSALLLRNSTTREEFSNIMKSVKSHGEPGFIFADDKECLYNPCLTADTWIMTNEGPRQIHHLVNKPFLAINNGKKYFCNTGFVCTGIRDVYNIKTSEGFEVSATGNHKFQTVEKSWKTVDELRDGDKIICHNHPKIEWSGFGNCSEGMSTGRQYMNVTDRIRSDLNYNMEITSSSFYKGFLSSFFSIHGQISSNMLKIGFYIQNHPILSIIQRMLLRLGIYSIINNGELIISNDALHVFSQKIPFVDISKQNAMKCILKSHFRSEKSNFYATVSTKSILGKRKVYDCTIEDIHSFDANGLMSHNCVEIGLYSYNEKKESGFSFCNLSEINMKTVTSEQDFYDRCKAASIMGTFQASYTDFGYLGKITREIVEREALIGVSMTGMMDNPKIAFDENILRKGAEIVKSINKEVANLIGINVAARTTCVKPAGTSSCILSTASGVHPSYAYRYFRRVQTNSTEDHLDFFAKYNPNAVQKSVWGKNDMFITFLCKSNKDAICKNDLTAVELLEKVKLVQTSWVHSGKNEELCVIPCLSHNVSNTINVKDDEWKDAEKFIYDNRNYFSGIAMLPASGDLIYNQAPFQEVLSHEEIAKKYGAGALFASGLIVHAHNAFSGSLHDACDALLYNTKFELPSMNDVTSLVSLTDADDIFKKMRWIAQAKKFAFRHFDNDITKMTHCLKLVDAWKLWCDLKRTYKHVPWENFREENDNTSATSTQYVACSGGSCEVINF